MSEREMNKKGQEMSLTTILLIVLGLVVVVVIILAVSGFFGPIFAGLKLAPSGLATLVKACNGYVQIDSKTDYCTFRSTTIDSKTEYLNCEDDRVQKDMDSTLTGKISSCGASAIKDKCAELVRGSTGNAVVNQKPCSDFALEFNCNSNFIKGFLIDKNAGLKCPSTQEPTKTKTLTSGFQEAQSSICCVAP